MSRQFGQGAVYTQLSWNSSCQQQSIEMHNCQTTVLTTVELLLAVQKLYKFYEKKIHFVLHTVDGISLGTGQVMLQWYHKQLHQLLYRVTAMHYL